MRWVAFSSLQMLPGAKTASPGDPCSLTYPEREVCTAGVVRRDVVALTRINEVETIIDDRALSRVLNAWGDALL